MTFEFPPIVSHLLVNNLHANHWMICFFFELSIKYPSLVLFEETFDGCYNLHGDRGGKLGILGEVSQVNEFVNLLVVLSCVHVDGLFTLISYSLPWDDLFPDHVQ